MKDEKKGLGFSVYGGVSKGGCYIRDIVSDPALTDGRLKTGDRLLQVMQLYGLLQVNHLYRSLQVKHLYRLLQVKHL